MGKRAHEGRGRRGRKGVRVEEDGEWASGRKKGGDIGGGRARELRRKMAIGQRRHKKGEDAGGRA